MCHRPVRRVGREAGIEFSKYVSRFELKNNTLCLKISFYYNLGLRNKTIGNGLGLNMSTVRYK